MPKEKKQKMSRTKPIYTKKNINEKRILSIVKYFAEKTIANYRPPLTLSEAGYDEDSYIQFEDIPPPQLEAKIERILLDICHSIQAGEQRYMFNIPSHTPDLQVYLERIGRYVLKKHEVVRSFTSHPQETVITSRILQIVYDLLRKNLSITKHDLFHMDVNLFEDQRKLDYALEDVVCQLRCTPNSLNVVAKEKGLMMGRIIIKEDNDYIDCSKMGKGAKGIPLNTNCIHIVESDALFILLVKNDTVFYSLAEERFYNKYPCIIMTASGNPDAGTRTLLNKFNMELKIPVLFLTDADPHGLQILMSYFGSKNMSCLNLATPNILWLGLKHSDLEKFGIPLASRRPMSEDDIKLAKSLMNEKSVELIPDLYEELNYMVVNREKAELEVFNCFDLRYLIEVYLPMKLREMMVVDELLI